jgi:flagellar basal-body rod modification protein FlgD
MSAVDALSSFSNTNGTTGATGFSALTAEDFSKIIFTELSKQDPLAPNDTNALLQQISSVRAIQSDMDLTSKLTSLVNENEFSAAATLIGKTISGVDENFERVTGKVKALSRTVDGAVLTLAGGQRVLVSNVDQILDSTTNPANPGTPTNPTTPPPPASGNPGTPNNQSPDR